VTSQRDKGKFLEEESKNCKLSTVDCKMVQKKKGQEGIGRKM
jgi:hypothetical protein